MTRKIKSNEKEKSPLPITNSVAPASAGATKKAVSISNPASKAAKTIPPVTTKANTEKTLKKEKEKEKTKKVKMIRDSFTLPESDYAKLSELKKKCLEAGVHVKKSELMRAGLLNLSKLPSASLLKAVGQVEIIKTGRPAKA